MSIVTTPMLELLWREAQQQGAHEIKAGAFWNHYLSKHAFPEEHWSLLSQADPALQSLRRVDIIVIFIDNMEKLRVLIMVEIKKKDVSPAAIRECELQALDACRKHFASHDQEFVYAVTAYGTRAKAWVYERDGIELIPLDPEGQPWGSGVVDYQRHEAYGRIRANETFSTRSACFH